MSKEKMVVAELWEVSNIEQTFKTTILVPCHPNWMPHNSVPHGLVKESDLDD